jgi:hypothetical protein
MAITRSDIDDVVLFCTKLGAVPMPKLKLTEEELAAARSHFVEYTRLSFDHAGKGEFRKVTSMVEPCRCGSRKPPMECCYKEPAIICEYVGDYSKKPEDRRGRCWLATEARPE